MQIYSYLFLFCMIFVFFPRGVIQLHRHRLAVIVHHGAAGGGQVEVFRGLRVGVHQHYVEATCLQHTLERPLATGYCQCAGGVVVGEVYGGVFALLVVVVGALVLIQAECAVGTGIDV